MVEKGKQISLEYTLTLEDGTKVDSNVGGDPLVYKQGEGQIVPGLEEQLEGLAPGAERRVTVAPDKGYGPVNPNAFQEVESNQIPEEARREGALLVARDQQGNQHQIRVHEMKGEKAVVDFNHPLAGKTLTFDVKVLSVR